MALVFVEIIFDAHLDFLCENIILTITLLLEVNSRSKINFRFKESVGIMFLFEGGIAAETSLVCELEEGKRLSQ